MHTTVILLKPRSRELGLHERIRKHLVQNELEIVGEAPIVFDETSIRLFAPHVKDEHVTPLLAYLNEDTTTALLVTGPNALAIGLALRQTIRDEHQTVQPFTLIHASDSTEAAERERCVLFGD